MKKTFKFILVTIIVFIITAVCITFQTDAAKNSNAKKEDCVSNNETIIETTIKTFETTFTETECTTEDITQQTETTNSETEETTVTTEKEENIIETTTIPNTEIIETEINTATQPIPEKELLYPINYTDNTCTITIYKEWYRNAWCYAAHIEFTNFSRLGTECANGSYNNGYETTSHCSKRLGSILTVNGCYSAPYLNYTVVRNGVIYNGADRNLCLPAVYSNKTGLLLSVWETGGTQDIVNKNVTELVNNKTITDTFCFGPPNLQNGIISGTNSGARAQRTFIGTNGNAGDIWIVVSDGRYNDGVSAGLTGYETAEYLLSKGCIFGVNLDGGGSSTMCFNGEILNANKNNERAVVDFLWFK